MTASCPGFASYTNLSNGQVEVAGNVMSFDSEARISPLLTAWESFGGALTDAAEKHSVPLPWLVGIMMAESKGSPQACSPCSACRSALCAAGAGKSCCAFGLMQFTAPTAEQYGVTPTQLMESPGVAIDVAAQLVRDLADVVGGMDIVRIAAAYNGGFNRCGKEGTTFGWQTNGDYPMTVVTYANTFVELNLKEPSRFSSAGALLVLAGLAMAYAIYTRKV